MNLSARPRRSHRARLSLAVLVATAALLAGTVGAAAADDPVVASTAARRTASTHDAILASHISRFAAGSLFGPLVAQSTDGNLVYSPASLALAMGMLRAGATGSSAQQIDHFFHTTSAAQFAQAMNALDLHLNALSKPGANDQGHLGDAQVSSANSLWGQQGVTWQSAFLGVLASRFGTGMHTVDYAHDPEGARQAINQWVSDQTHGKIPDLIPAGAIGNDAVFTLVNALYFKAPWFREFDATSPEAPFRTALGRMVSTPTMHLGEGITYARGAGWTAVRLPYAGQKLAMTVIVPDNGRFAAARDQLERGTLLPAALGARFTTGPGDLWLPRFDIRTKAPLTEILQGLGVRAPFAASHDLDPISHQLAGEIAIKNVRQEATITVDEKGTEAAAATSVEGVATAVASDPFELHVDHPFFFVVHDIATGTPLFVGQVGNPTAS